LPSPKKRPPVPNADTIAFLIGVDMRVECIMMYVNVVALARQGGKKKKINAFSDMKSEGGRRGKASSGLC